MRRVRNRRTCSEQQVHPCFIVKLSFPRILWKLHLEVMARYAFIFLGKTQFLVRGKGILYIEGMKMLQISESQYRCRA